MEKRTVVSLLGVLATLVAACGDEDGSSGGSSCEAICERIEAADCDLSAPNCLQACKDDNEDTPKACASQLGALSSCFGHATFQCDATGYPEANGCKTQLEAWLDCREQEGDVEDDLGNGNQGGSGNQLPDNGNQNGNGNQLPDNGFLLSCNPPASADACDKCVGNSCCAEIEACGADCQALFDCIDTCANDLCFEACVKAHPKGTSAVSDLSECLDSACDSECNDGST